jgi:hypothetical protein
MSKDVDALKDGEGSLEELMPIGIMFQLMLDLIPMRPRRSVFLWGPPGIGKSSIVYQVAELLGYEVLELRLGDRDPIDFRGVPVPVLRMKDGSEVYLTAAHTVKPEDVEGGITRSFPPSYLALPNKKIIIFLDEMNMADKAVIKVAQQMVLDHKVADIVLPENIVIIGAGNRETDGAFVQRMPKPTLNRFIHYFLREDADGWIDWAVKNDIHPMVIAYIKFKPTDLFQFNPKSVDKAFPTPRTWEFASDLLKANLRVGLFQSLAGTIGKGAAIGFQAFMKLYEDIPDINEIFNNPAGAPLPSNPSVSFSVCILLARKATFKNLLAIRTYLERMGREYCAYTVKYITDINEKLSETPEFVGWSIKYQDLLVSDRSLPKPKSSKKKGK